MAFIFMTQRTYTKDVLKQIDAFKEQHHELIVRNRVSGSTLSSSQQQQQQQRQQKEPRQQQQPRISELRRIKARCSMMWKVHEHRPFFWKTLLDEEDEQ